MVCGIITMKTTQKMKVTSGYVVRVAPGSVVGRQLMVLLTLAPLRDASSESYCSHSSKEGAGFQVENGTFQSSLMLTERTRFHTCPEDGTGSGQVPIHTAQPPLRPASCSRRPISMWCLTTGANLVTDSKPTRFLGSKPTRFLQRALFKTGLLSYPLT